MIGSEHGPVRVCLVSPLPPPTGGIAQWTERLRTDLESNGRVRLLVVDSSVRSRAPYQLSIGWRFYAGLLTSIRVATSLIRCLTRQRPEVVHINTSGSLGLTRDIVLAIIARAARARVVGHLRFGRTPEIFAAKSWEFRLLSTFLKLSHVCVAIDRPTLETIQASGVAPCLLLPNYAHAVTEHAPPSSKRKTVLFVGSVSRAKGIEDLLAAWMAMDATDWRLEIIGAYDPDYVTKLMRDHALESVHFRGALERNDVIREMSTAGIVVLPSHTEGFPNVVVESMSVGTPVVATDVGAISEILADGAGTVVPPRNVPALARALVDLIHSAPQRHAQGACGLDRFEKNYEASIVLNRYVSLWTDRITGESSSQRQHSGKFPLRRLSDEN